MDDRVAGRFQCHRTRRILIDKMAYELDGLRFYRFVNIHANPKIHRTHGFSHLEYVLLLVRLGSLAQLPVGVRDVVS
jgi:hypothetical protein